MIKIIVWIVSFSCRLQNIFIPYIYIYICQTRDLYSYDISISIDSWEDRLSWYAYMFWLLMFIVHLTRQVGSWSEHVGRRSEYKEEDLLQPDNLLEPAMRSCEPRSKCCTLHDCKIDIDRSTDWKNIPFELGLD